MSWTREDQAEERDRQRRPDWWAEKDRELSLSEFGHLYPFSEKNIIEALNDEFLYLENFSALKQIALALQKKDYATAGKAFGDALKNYYTDKAYES